MTAGFPLSCESCHKFSDTSWTQGTFSHATFPLSGVHGTQSCGACHKNGVYQGTARTCVGCHQTAYNTTKNPNHVTAGFPLTCESCHKFSDTSWTQGRFTHSSFSLSGVHATQACGTCHKNGVYQGTPRVCSGCHLAAYNTTRDPNHLAAGFPTTCESCHSFGDASWSLGRFNHSWFPITSGKHAGNPCNACHTTPTNYRLFTCISCHTRGETDPEHREIPAYRFDSNACYACHPQGRED